MCLVKILRNIVLKHIVYNIELGRDWKKLLPFTNDKKKCFSLVVMSHIFLCTIHTTWQIAQNLVFSFLFTEICIYFVPWTEFRDQIWRGQHKSLSVSKRLNSVFSFVLFLFVSNKYYLNYYLWSCCCWHVYLRLINSCLHSVFFLQKTPTPTKSNPIKCFPSKIFLHTNWQIHIGIGESNQVWFSAYPPFPFHMLYTNILNIFV